MCAVVRSTQDQEKHFDGLLWSASLYDAPSSALTAAAGKNSVLALLIDMSKEHTFEVSPSFFPTVRLRSPRPPPLLLAQSSQNNAAGGRGKQKHVPGRQRQRLTASVMLSQSSLGLFGGDSLEGGTGRVGRGFGDIRDGAEQDKGESRVAEDARETYSSQAALFEPGQLGKDEDEGGEEEGKCIDIAPSSVPLSQSDGGSGEEGDDGNGGGGGDRSEGDGGDDNVFLEMSQVNREPCMRSLLLVVDAERRLFEDTWLDRVESSRGV